LWPDSFRSCGPRFFPPPKIFMDPLPSPPAEVVAEFSLALSCDPRFKAGSLSFGSKSSIEPPISQENLVEVTTPSPPQFPPTDRFAVQGKVGKDSSPPSPTQYATVASLPLFPSQLVDMSLFLSPSTCLCPSRAENTS